MNILNKLSIRNLKMNKKRTISTIIGIILSVALICAVSSMVVSFQVTLVEEAKNETGYWHLKLYDVDEVKEKELEANRNVKDLHKTYEMGYAKLEKSQNEYKPYARVVSMDNSTFEFLKFNLVKGRFPQNENEIIVSKHIMENGKVDLEVGNTLKLNIGQRENKKVEGFFNQEVGYDKNNEKLINTEEKEFTIVGIIERPTNVFEDYSCPGYTVITTNMIDGKSDTYITLNNVKEYKETICGILGENDYTKIATYSKQLKYDYKLNSALLRWEAASFSDSTLKMLYNVAGIVIFIILFTSVFCIRNSIAIATTEKIKMYGMLASVGATKKQIRKNVKFESMILGLIGIPLGVLSGLFAVFILLKIVNLLLGDVLFSHNAEGFIFTVNIYAILISIVLGIVTIYLSSISSARKASRVSPIESLRNSAKIKLRAKKLKVPKIVSKIFGTGGTLAYKNLKRSKKKYRTTVVSITVSIVLFITMNVFITNMVGQANYYYKDLDYDIQVSQEGNKELTQDTINKIRSLNNIEEVFTAYKPKTNRDIKITDSSKFNPETISKVYEVDDDKGTEKQVGYIEVVGLDDSTFRKYVKKAGLNYESVKKVGILSDYNMEYDEEANKTIQRRMFTYKKGDNIEGVFEGYDEKEEKQKIYGTANLNIGAITDVRAYGIENHYGNATIVLNIDEYPAFDFIPRLVSIKSSDPDTLEEDIKKVDKTLYTNNIAKHLKDTRSMILVINIFLYGFIAVITLIGVTNIFNTITSNMELRQREFATLKSIGMARREFNKMVNLETIFYSTKSLIYGIILGLLGTFLLYKAFSINLDKGAYIPYEPIVISVVFVFVLVFIIMRYSISKINKQNTIETIRNENI